MTTPPLALGTVAGGTRNPAGGADAELIWRDYIVSGLRVRSAMELPSAIPADVPHQQADVAIAFVDAPPRLEAPQRSGPDWQIEGETLTLQIPGVLQAAMTAGTRIDVYVEEDRPAADTALYVLGTCFAVILQQRGRVVMHASAVSVGGQAMLFCGHSGAGKSTLAAMLAERGYPLLNDDVCNLSAAPAGGDYVVYPDGRMLKLWEASMQHLARSGRESDRVRHDLEKYYAAPATVEREPRAVGAVYVLEACPDAEAPALQRLGAAEALASLTANVYRPGLVRAMQMTAAYFQVSVAIQQRAGVFRLRRPMDFARVHETFDLLERHWAELDPSAILRG